MIFDMAKCNILSSGNVKAWKTENLEINKAKVELIPDPTLFCKDIKHLVIIPKRHTLPTAKQLCKVIGGKIVKHYTAKENEEVISIVRKHEKQCMAGEETDKRNLGKLVWLGIKRVKSVWYLSLIHI